MLQRICDRAPQWRLLTPHRRTMTLSQRRRFPPGSWVRTRPLLKPIGSIPLVDPTEFLECVKRRYTAMETPAYCTLMPCSRHGFICKHLGPISLHHDGISSPPAAISQRKIQANVLTAGALPRTQLRGFTALPYLDCFGLDGEGRDHGYNTIQYNIRLLGLDRMQANNTGSGYA